MQTAEECLKAGDPEQALQVLQQAVRAKPGDVKLRIFLFQLLCVLGQWERAAAQLQLCGELDAGALAMVNTYREALKCEVVREAVFAGRTTPVVFGQPQAWVAWLIEALQAQGRGEPALAQDLRHKAFDVAPATSGRLDGVAFEWMADADSRLGPVLEAIVNGRYAWVPFLALARVVVEAPEDLRDLVWVPAHLEFPNGGESVALIPTRYVGTADREDGGLRLSRKTLWENMGAEQYAGVGMRVLTTDAGDHDLLAVRTIELDPSPQAPQEDAPPAEAD